MRLAVLLAWIAALALAGCGKDGGVDGDIFVLALGL